MKFSIYICFFSIISYSTPSCRSPNGKCSSCKEELSQKQLIDCIASNIGGIPFTTNTLDVPLVNIVHTTSQLIINCTAKIKFHNIEYSSNWHVNGDSGKVMLKIDNEEIDSLIDLTGCKVSISRLLNFRLNVNDRVKFYTLNGSCLALISADYLLSSGSYNEIKYYLLVNIDNSKNNVYLLNSYDSELGSLIYCTNDSVMFMQTIPSEFYKDSSNIEVLSLRAYSIVQPSRVTEIENFNMKINSIMIIRDDSFNVQGYKIVE